MSEWIISGVQVRADAGIGYEEALIHVDELVVEYAEQNKRLLSIDLRLEDDCKTVNCICRELSKIIRLRRITGYLSNIDNFNDGKRGELRDRTTHKL